MIAAGVVRRSFPVAAALVLSAGNVCAASEQTSPASPSLARIAISFKMDPLVFGGTYGGERWVSPPTFSSPARPGREATVEARVRGMDAAGRPVKVSPDWIPADAEMVTVVPASDGSLDHVRVIVRKLGESKLRVVSGGTSKELLVTAKAAGANAMQVTITQ